MKNSKDPRLTTAQLRELRRTLESKRDELRAQSKQHLDLAMRSDEDRPAEEMDAANRTEGEDEMLGLAEHEQRLLAEVNHALAKIDLGTYGVSEASGRPIALARLRAIPWARNEAEVDELRERDRLAR